MAPGSFRFERFVLDPADRQLRREGAPVEVNGRYFDALELLVRESGRLVSKDRFLEEVWHGVPVTDEALTQCIRTLRKQLGDDAARPRFIETVPKHGYRFIAPVESDHSATAPANKSPALPARAAEVLRMAAAGTMGGAIAGAIGGLIYGLAASQPSAGTGAISALLVLLLVTLVVAIVGAAGVSSGIAAARLAIGDRRASFVLGGALGGTVVGAIVKLLATDAFTLLVGQSPGDVTGAGEGALLGAAVGLAASFVSSGTGRFSLRRGFALGAGLGGGAGLIVATLGGRLMGGSLDLLPGSRLGLDQLGAIAGEQEFGPMTQIVTAGLEGALFGGCVVGAMVIAGRTLGSR